MCARQSGVFVTVIFDTLPVSHSPAMGIGSVDGKSYARFLAVAADSLLPVLVNSGLLLEIRWHFVGRFSFDLQRLWNLCRFSDPGIACSRFLREYPDSGAQASVGSCRSLDDLDCVARFLLCRV